METVFSTSVTPTVKPSYACVRCFERKIKCDRAQPACGACLKHEVECVYRPRLPPRKRRKVNKRDTLSADESETGPKSTKSQTGPISTTSVHNSPFKDEGPVSDRANQLPTPASTNAETETCAMKGIQLVQMSGRSAFVDNNLWNRVAEELHDPNQSLQDSSHGSDEELSEDEQIFALGATPKASRRLQHPPNDIIWRLWEIFKTNIDPLIKIVHVPTFELAVKKALKTLDQLPRGFEALMFAVYSVAILSMRETECEQILGGPRDKVLPRFVSYTRTALSRAKFMTTTSLMVLQALFLHIYSIRNNCEARLVFTLNGVILRIAEGIGIHRDGASLGLPPFETEIRRRIWWQFKMHDWKTAELTGLTKFGAVDTHPDAPKQPANVNDDEIYPGMAQPPADTARATDMIFCKLRADICNYAANRMLQIMQQGRDHRNWEDALSRPTDDAQDELMNELTELLESKIIRFCDPTEPLHLLSMLVARSAVDVAHFNSKHPRRWVNKQDVPDATRKAVWEVSLRLIDKFNIAHSTPSLQGFAWHTQYYIHWQPLIHILDCLRSTPFLPGAEKAWKLVETLYENNPNLITDMKNPIQGAVCSLSLKAYEARQALSATTDFADTYTPELIVKIRRQRDSLEAERMIRSQKHAHVRHNQTHTSWTKGQPSAGFDDAFTMTSNIDPHVDVSTQNQRLTSSTPDDSFWFAQSFDDAFLHPTNGTMVFNTDDMLDPWALGDISADQAFDWAQWDTLVGMTNFDVS